MQQPEFMPRAINIEKGFWNKTETKSWLDATIFTSQYYTFKPKPCGTDILRFLFSLDEYYYLQWTHTQMSRGDFFPIKHCFDIDQEIKKKN